MYLLFAVFILPIIFGFLFLPLFWPSRAQTRSLWLVIGCLSVGLGIGVSSLVFIIGLVLFGTLGRLFMIIEISVLITLMVIFLYLINKKDVYFRPRVKAVPITNRNWRLYLTWGFYAVFATSIMAFGLMTLNRPHGGTDAWTIWNATARFLNGGCETWTDLFSHLSPLSHADYPLLLSGSIARIWSYTKNVSTAAPALFSMTFTMATVVLLISAVMQFKSKLHGYLAGLAILALPGFIKVGAGQIADIPLGFYMLSTIVFFCIGDHSPDERWPFFFWGRPNGRIVRLDKERRVALYRGYNVVPFHHFVSKRWNNKFSERNQHVYCWIAAGHIVRFLFQDSNCATERPACCSGLRDYHGPTR
ncbi:MAG: hypothetical protein ACYS0I_19740 [Planctomycetota bacterium]|jgi:hypothetical protein